MSKLTGVSFLFFMVIFMSSVSLISSEWEGLVSMVLVFKESTLNLIFLMDSLALTMIFVVSLVSFSVLVYSIEYMKEDVFNKKFMLTLCLFIISMLILVISADFFWLMVGWDGLGISSFFLILFFQSWKSFNSAMITFILNRLGDVFLLVSLAFWVGKGSTFSCEEWSVSEVFFQLTLVSGAVSKSAQFPFSSWLPLAMAAPTPVSSLVHSSTLVAAGVFLIVRFKVFLSGVVDGYLLSISFLTLFLAAVSSMGEYDLKKIIALSTLSHISLMVFMISIKALKAAIFHLMVHAFFKSLIFMIAGILIHNNSGSQDVRYVSLSKMDSFVGVSFVFSLLSMAGVPFLSGFFSKEKMLSFLSEEHAVLFLFIFFLAAGITSSYSIRILLSLFREKWVSEDTHTNGMMIFGFMTFFSLSSGVIFFEYLEDVSFTLLFLKTFVFFVLFLGGILGVQVVKVQGSSSWIKWAVNMWWLKSLSGFFQSFLFMVSFFYMYKVDFKGSLLFTEKISFLLQKVESMTILLLSFSSLFLVSFTFFFLVVCFLF